MTWPTRPRTPSRRCRPSRPTTALTTRPTPSTTPSRRRPRTPTHVTRRQPDPDPAAHRRRFRRHRCRRPPRRRPGPHRRRPRPRRPVGRDRPPPPLGQRERPVTSSHLRSDRRGMWTAARTHTPAGGRGRTWAPVLLAGGCGQPCAPRCPVGVASPTGGPDSGGSGCRGSRCGGSRCRAPWAAGPAGGGSGSRRPRSAGQGGEAGESWGRLPCWPGACPWLGARGSPGTA